MKERCPNVVPDNLIPAKILMPGMVRSDLDSSVNSLENTGFIFRFLHSVSSANSAKQ
jgi:hypothetical protein